MNFVPLSYSQISQQTLELRPPRSRKQRRYHQ